MITDYEITVGPLLTSDPEYIHPQTLHLEMYLSFPNGTTTGAKVQLTCSPHNEVNGNTAIWFDWTPGVVTTNTFNSMFAVNGIRVVNLDSVKSTTLSVRGNNT